MAVSSFLNSRIVKRRHAPAEPFRADRLYQRQHPPRRLSQPGGFMPLWLFFSLLMIVQFARLGGVQHELAVHGAARRRGRHRRFRLRLHPDRGRRAARHDDRPAVQRHDDADRAGYLSWARLALGCVLIAENGRLFGVGKESTPEAARASSWILRMPSRSMMNFIGTARSPRRILRRKYFSWRPWRGAPTSPDAQLMLRVESAGRRRR